MTNREEVFKDLLSKLFKDNMPISGTVYAGTGVGKTRLAISWLKEVLSKFEGKALYVVPTTTLRDHDIPEEFTKWGEKELMERVEFICYRSVPKVCQNAYTAVVLDEAHNITPLTYHSIRKINPNKTLCLTATKPRDRQKCEMIESLAPPRVIYATQKGIEDRVVSPFEIHFLYTSLESVAKTAEVSYIDKKTKAKKTFITTETERYKFLCQKVESAKQNMFSRRDKASQMYYRITLGERARFLYNLESKTKVAKKLLEKLYPNRVIVFSKSIDQIEKICVNTYHSKKSNRKGVLDAFNNKEINILGCVDALNEGKNLTDVDIAVIVSLDSNPKNIIQRIGRVIRFKEGKLAKIYIVVSRNTRDEEWVQKALFSYRNIPTFHHYHV